MHQDITKKYVKEFRKPKTYKDFLGMFAALGKVPVGVDIEDPSVQRIMKKAKEKNRSLIRRVRARSRNS